MKAIYENRECSSGITWNKLNKNIFGKYKSISG